MADWSEIPSVVFIEILQYLHRKDIISSCSTCRQWRSHLFNCRLWRSVSLAFINSSDDEVSGLKFIIDQIGRHIRELTLRFSLTVAHFTDDMKSVDRVVEVLKLVPAKQIRKISVQCRTPAVFDDLYALFDTEGKDHNRNYWLPNENNGVGSYLNGYYAILGNDGESRFVDALLRLVTDSQSLTEFSLGGLRSCLCRAPLLVQRLAKCHAAMLEKLHLASVSGMQIITKVNTEHCYNIGNLQAFTNLSELSLDYIGGQLSESLLDSLARPGVHPLRLLRVFVATDNHVYEHVADLARANPIRDDAWACLRAHSPALRVHVTFFDVDGCHGDDASILQPSAPVSALAFVFASPFRGSAGSSSSALGFARQHYAATLRSLCVLRDVEREPAQYRDDDEEDELVLLAWKCKNLESFTLIGYEFAQEDIFAIARLLKSKLKHFCIPQCCIATTQEDGVIEIVEF
ncbi:PREDICTED: uncharacterized protein LOC106805645 [Priapulus caudatus]|uniref:Uncharacterized protein LOC106805645 n=1 Tax=Priapulus caudatus TaxID=37621 RepID=A0ABM1DS98_PRICU|nr:PREDICTED: uncharacterized protein LOC106805645 [Priapulus caudatus]